MKTLKSASTCFIKFGLIGFFLSSCGNHFTEKQSTMKVTTNLCWKAFAWGNTDQKVIFDGKKYQLYSYGIEDENQCLSLLKKCKNEHSSESEKCLILFKKGYTDS